MDKTTAIARLTWTDFDNAVDRMAAAARSPVGVFGVPRGGLPLAVALSHRLGVPLLTSYPAGALIVDDVIETGSTLGMYRRVQGAQLMTWATKGDSWDNVFSVLHFPIDTWLVFPWEAHFNAEEDRAGYYASRQ